MHYICSVWPGKLEAERPGYVPDSTFKLEPAKKATLEERATVSTLAVGQAKQREYTGHGRYGWHVINADSLAADLVNQWRTGKSFANMPEMAGIGLWIVDSPTPPTQAQLLRSEEFAAAHEQLAIYAKWIIEQARHYWQSPTLRRDISPIHHLMAGYLGIENEQWQVSQGAQQMKKCVYCRTSIEFDAVVCPRCTRTIDGEAYSRIASKHSAIDLPPAPAAVAVPPAAETAPATTTA